MKSTKHRGRPIDNDTPILTYIQDFKEYDGTEYKWEFDKTIWKNGPLSVIISDPQYNYSDKLLKELDSINKKYISAGRKPRVTKLDKERIETLNKELDEYYYSLYPDERPKTRKNAKIKKN